MARDTNFYYSFLVLPAQKRRAIVAVWDFCRAVDDAVDRPNVAGANPTFELARWRSELARCYGDEKDEPGTAQGVRLKSCISRFNLPQQPFLDLIDGVAMDVDRRRYETFEDFYQYCLRVASSVGLICIEIFGHRNAGTRDYAVALGIALQLTNVIRDVPTDLERDRMYLPLEDLHRFDCDETDLARGLSSPVCALLEFECQRARSYYAKATAMLPAEDRRRLVAAEIMGAIYFAILNKIERRGYDVFSEVVRVPRHRRAMIATTTWARTMIGV